MSTALINKQESVIDSIKESKAYLVPLCIYTFLFLFFCSKMSPLYPSNEWADVNLYFSIGKAIFNGQTLYAETFDPKGPLIFIIYGFGYLISNATFFGVFLFLFAGWAVALTLIYLMAKEIIGQEILALLAAMLTPVFALSYMHSGGSAEEFILLLQLISLYFFVNYFREKKTTHQAKYMLVLGVTTSIILLIKLNLTIFCIFPLLGMFISIIINEGVKAFVKNAAYYLAGLALVALPIAIYFVANGALAEAFNTYVVLNKELAITISLQELVSNGASRVYALFRYNIIEALLLTVGIVYFPLAHLPNKIGKVSFVVGGIALCGMIFFAGVFHFYYPLPLYVFMPLGIISVFAILAKQLNILASTKLIYVTLVICLLCGYKATTLFGLGIAALARQAEPEGVGYTFAKIIGEEENPTLLNLAFGDTNNIFTVCNIVPNVRFFSSLNISHDKFPILRDEQTKYIENKETQFIIIQRGTELNYFEKLTILDINYELVDSYSGFEQYQDGRVKKSYSLYKRR